MRDGRLLRIGGGTDEIMKYVIHKGVYKRDMDQENTTAGGERSLFG